jgi:hypothetical protein
MGHIVGLNLVGFCKIDMLWVVVACYAPDQISMFTLEEEAAAHVFTFAHPVSFCNLLGLGCLRSALHLGMHTLGKVVQLQDLVYSDCNRFYTGTATVDKVSPLANLLSGY